MDMQSEIERGTERALLLLSEKRSEAAFNDLLAYAADACLVHPPVFLAEGEQSKYDTTSGEEKIVQRVGARALSTLLETADGIHPPQEPEDKFHVSELFSSPYGFSDIANNRILENAERFGQALIDESFAILGKDAPRWVEKLKKAATEEEELAVVDWLNERICVISDRSRSPLSAEDEKEHFYPPFRISPKFIGSYPNLDVQPSCLSASIIATSFFQKAGKPTLHAGVTAPASETGNELLMNTIRLIVSREKESTYQGIDAQSPKLGSLAKSSRDWSRRPLAQHGAVYTKLNSGWVQFDAYNNATFSLFGEEDAHMNNLYEKLESWKGVVPHLEFATSTLPDKNLQLASAEFAPLTFALSSFSYDGHPELIERISDALSTIPAESYASYLYANCLTPLLNTDYVDGVDEEHLLAVEHVLLEASEQTLGKNGMYDSRMRRTFDNALREFIQWSDTPEAFIERCANDPHYRARRAEDFIQIPTMMALLNAQLTAQIDPGFSHLSIDVGNPAIRIGLATLGDFARYDEHPLPASFWITHWPGSVSILENIDNPPASLADTALIFNTLLWQQSHPFTSGHNHDKITSFLSDKREDLHDGDQQEGS